MKETRGAIWTFGQMYARFGRHTLGLEMYAAVCSVDVQWRPPNVHSVNHTGECTWDHRTNATF
jgi:hypothetical protein